MGSGGDLHQRAISGGIEVGTKLDTTDAGWAAQSKRCNACACESAGGGRREAGTFEGLTLSIPRRTCREEAKEWDL